MDKLNLNFSNSENIIKSICFVISLLSWLLLIITGWISIKWLKNDDGIIWTIHKFEISEGNENYYPIQMHSALIYIVFILALMMTLAGFILYIIKSIFKKDDAVYSGMMGQWSKFHFFPLLCISALFIIGENVDNKVFQSKENHYNDMSISGFIFSIIGLISLIFIYIMTELNTDWYIVLTLKKGTYSCFIVLMWYYFCYSIYGLREIDIENNEDLMKDKLDWKKGCGVAFSIIVSLGSIIFSFFFRDLVVSIMNAFIYIGLIAFYFKQPEKNRKEKYLNNNADGIIDIIMLILSIVLIIFLIIKYRDECLKS